MVQLEYPYTTLPAVGKKFAVAPGVYWLRMPLPFALDHINLWLLEDGDGWLLVDTGFDTKTSRAIWEQLWASELDGKPIKGVLVTHYHPDHLGLCHWISQYWQAPVLMSRGEWQMANQVHSVSAADLLEHNGSFLQAHGLPQPRVQALTGRGNTYRKSMERVPDATQWLAEGDEILTDSGSWQVVIGRGHAPEHVCLYNAAQQLFISGDQVLPTISSNLMVRFTDPHADPVTEFVQSLSHLQGFLPPETLVLPSHGLPFYGVQGRLQNLIDHHVEQLDLLQQACTGQGLTAYDALPVLFKRELDDHQMMFAMGESIAHLNNLWCSEGVQRIQHNETWRFVAS